MYLKVVLVLLGVSWCSGQLRSGVKLPVVSKRFGFGPSTPQILPSADTVRNFVTYPNLVGRNNYAYNGYQDALQIAGPALRAAPIFAPAQLEKVATYGLTNGLTGGIALGANSQVLGPVLAAIITHRTAEIVDVPTPDDIIHPQVLIVEPNLLPVTIEFRSQSSPVNINQVHIPGPPGEVKETRSEEEPDRVLHEVIKPVIQEVREIIQPFRKITQEILPVQEEVHSVVARGENRKVLQEVAIPAPQPIQLHSVAQPIAITAPQQIIAKQIVAQPVIRSLGESIPVLSRTIVRAGLIGGARVFEAPDEPLVAESFNKRSGKSTPSAQESSVNNRGAVKVAAKRHANQ